MNAIILGAAILFWWRMFDFRRLPADAGYGSRLMMLWIATLAHIGIGAYLTLKGDVLYSAYGSEERLFGIGALTDETVGGFIIWVPSALLCLAAAILVIHLWGRHEDRVWAEHSGWSSSNSAALLFPTTGEALVDSARPKNRALAIAIVAFVIAVFGMSIFAGVLNHINARTLHAHGPAVAHHFSGHYRGL
jgi:putative membrane protein